MAERVGIGIIGAGGFTQTRLLPNLQKLPGVEVVAICTRTLETVQKVAQSFQIPHATTDRKEVLARPDIDAVLVVTQPNAHYEIVMDALAAGKHVLCQTRMALNTREAREMTRKAQENGLKGMLVRSGGYVKTGRFVKHLLDTGYVGRVYQVISCRYGTDFLDSKAPLQRRQNAEVYGPVNPLSLGGTWDTLESWFGPPKRVWAQAHTFTPQRAASPGGPLVPIGLPDTITAIAEVGSGALITNIQSGVAKSGDSRIEIFGEEGTLLCRGDEVLGAQGREDLAVLSMPPDMVDSSQVEEDFVRLIRGEITEAHPSFEDGVRNMEYMEAAYIAAKETRWVDLPLP